MLVSLDGHERPRTEPVPAEEPSQKPVHQSASPQYRVLLVDDDQGTRQLLQDILEKYSDVTIIGEAGDGKEAVLKAIEHKPDVILMDVALPYLDGIEATHCIKKACPHTVVICLTGQFSPPKYSAMRTAGAAAFVCKNEVLAIHDTIMYALGRWTSWD
jgi:DNA-binding NarL/FixJ family response regulator